MLQDDLMAGKPFCRGQRASERLVFRRVHLACTSASKPSDSLPFCHLLLDVALPPSPHITSLKIAACPLVPALQTMPSTFPFEVALQIVHFAHARRLDESRLEHRQRLMRLALACKAFNRIVQATLKMAYIAFDGRKWDNTVSRLQGFEAEGRPVEVFVRATVEGDPLKAIQRCGQTILALRYSPGPRFLQLPTLLHEDSFPDLESLSLNVPMRRSGLPSAPTPLTIRELVLSAPDSSSLAEVLDLNVTPHLRRLALYHVESRCDVVGTALQARLDERLEALQIGFARRGNRLDSLPQHGLATPVLLVVDSAHAIPAPETTDIAGLFPYLQLQSLTSLAMSQWFSAAQCWRTALDSLSVATEAGAGRKAVFLPLGLRNSTVTGLGARVSAERDRLLATIEKHGVEHVGWYHADEETGASFSEPFRRYLDRERLAGRM
ncbi:Proteophosphoglycan 5 [Rhodotorula toruloides ATCC 204091]|uniref:Proteophosphoglycan 5 n=1 Tax=Rhodotorula toruloides TaxID=5286 RepID=A0A2T0ABG1_RHOTO|nr:Proteophosphoglycan 5 [Rhodotorula toruloides ATCC 204091]PRQ75332.1 Proteophosphoglycan 5 [Rhodotorula toruloides]